MNFLNRNAGGIQAFAALLTLLVALAALFGVKWQIESADKIQRAQSARDIYREYLNIAINKPEFAQPNYCVLAGTQQGAAYENFVEYLLYTAEQTISVDADWVETFSGELKEHAQYLCSVDGTEEYSSTVAKLITDFQLNSCKVVPACP